MSEFIEVKTDDLTGQALDWAFAKVEGLLEDDTSGRNRGLCKPYRYSPSSDWFHTGPLIEKHLVGISYQGSEPTGGDWCAWLDENTTEYLGPTALIAACRSIVAAKLGDIVQVPKELIQ